MLFNIRARAIPDHIPVAKLTLKDTSRSEHTVSKRRKRGDV
jgi:hypothetical protein